MIKIYSSPPPFLSFLIIYLSFLVFFPSPSLLWSLSRTFQSCFLPSFIFFFLCTFCLFLSALSLLFPSVSSVCFILVCFFPSLFVFFPFVCFHIRSCFLLCLFPFHLYLFPSSFLSVFPSCLSFHRNPAYSSVRLFKFTYSLWCRELALNC
jgi:hypothetical protein